MSMALFKAKFVPTPGGFSETFSEQVVQSVHEELWDAYETAVEVYEETQRVDLFDKGMAVGWVSLTV